MSVIGLMTDFGLEDDYVGLMHAVITRCNASARVIDLSHNVEWGNIEQAAFMLIHDASYFPGNSVFAAVVDPGVGTGRLVLAVKHTRENGDAVYYLAPDNGLLDPVIDWWEREGQKLDVFSASSKELSQKLSKITSLPEMNLSSTFHGRDVYSPVAAWLADGNDVTRLFNPTDTWVTSDWRMPPFGSSATIGRVMFADHFGNLITDLPVDGRLGNVYIKDRDLEAVNTFSDIEKGHVAWLKGSKGTIEIVMNGQSAADVLNVGRGETVAFDPDDRDA